MGAKDATVEVVPGGFVLRYERWYPHPVEQVWSALTDDDELAGWLAAARLDVAVGGEVMLHWLNTDDEDGEAILHGRITALRAPELIEYATDIHGLMRWELHGEHEGTTLRFTDDSPAPGEHLLKVLAGWHIHLDHLEDALDGRPVDWSSWTPNTRATGSGLSWSDHYQRYSARLGR